MRVFQHAVVTEEGVEAQSILEYFPPPHCARGSHKVHLAGAAKRRASVCVDRVATAEVISAGLVRGEQSQSPIPFPPLRLELLEVVGCAITHHTADLRFRIALEYSQHPGEEVLFQSNVIVDEGNKASLRPVDPQVALDRRS